MNCRTHYIVLCKEISSPCQCCHTCTQLDLKKVQYQGRDGYYFKASRSLSHKAVHNLLIQEGVKHFELVGIAKSEVKSLGQSLKRRAPLDNDSGEEVLTKQYRTSVLSGVKLEVSKENSEFNIKLQALAQKCKKLEKQQEKTFLEQAQTSRNVLKLIENQNMLFMGFQNMTANSKEDLKKLTSATSQLTEDMKFIKNDQGKISELISKQTMKFEEGLKAMNFKSQQSQIRNSNSSGKTNSTSGPSAPEKSHPKTPIRTHSESILHQILGSTGIKTNDK